MMKWSDIKNKPSVLNDSGFLSSLKRNVITITNKVEATGNAIINIENTITELNNYSRTWVGNSPPPNPRINDVWYNPNP